MDDSRRTFLKKSGQVLLATSFTPSILSAQENTKKRFSMALSQYSLRGMLRNGSLKAVDFPSFTKNTFGINAIDLWEGGLPKDKLDDMKYMEQLRVRAEQAGTDLYLLMAGTLQSNPKAQDKSVASFDKSLDRAKALGCRFLRIFLRAHNLKDAVDALKKISDNAAQRDLSIIIEPSPGSKGQYGKFLAEVSQQLKHPNCTLMPDFGKLRNNVYEGTEAMLPYSKSVSAKMHSFDDKGMQPDFDYDRLAKIIIDSNFSGNIAIEWEGRKLKPVPGVKASQKLLKDSFAKYGHVIA